MVTEPDQQEIDTANILIQMSKNAAPDHNDYEIQQSYVIDKDHKLPVNSNRLEDVVDQINKTQNEIDG